MQYLFPLLCLFFVGQNTYASLEINPGGNLDLQYQQIKNSSEGKKLAGNDWEKSEIKIAHANLNSSMIYDKHEVDFNWFLRHSKSDLFERSSSYSTNRIIYPNTLISRNLFRMKHVYTNSHEKNESVVNQITYSWQDEDTEFKAGRMFIDFGDGLFFNPINPFNVPMVMTTLPNTQLGNDGIKFLLKRDPKLKLHIYILGDKQQLGGDEISRTALIRGDYQYTTNVHFNYIIGEDQKRHKFGLEWQWKPFGTEHRKWILQAVRESKRIDKQSNTEQLTHLLLAYHHNFNSIWSARIEVGTNDKDDIINEPNPQAFFIPVEHYVSLHNSFHFSDHVNINFNIVTSPETGFNYSFVDINHQYNKELQLHLFISQASGRDITKATEEKLVNQLYVADQIGIGMRSEF